MEMDRCGAPHPNGEAACTEPAGHRGSHGNGSVVRWLSPDQRR